MTPPNPYTFWAFVEAVYAAGAYALDEETAAMHRHYCLIAKRKAKNLRDRAGTPEEQTIWEAQHRLWEKRAKE